MTAAGHCVAHEVAAGRQQVAAAAYAAKHAAQVMSAACHLPDHVCVQLCHDDKCGSLCGSILTMALCWGPAYIFVQHDKAA